MQSELVPQRIFLGFGDTVLVVVITSSSEYCDGRDTSESEELSETGDSSLLILQSSAFLEISEALGAADGVNVSAIGSRDLPKGIQIGITEG